MMNRPTTWGHGSAAWYMMRGRRERHSGFHLVETQSLRVVLGSHAITVCAPSREEGGEDDRVLAVDRCGWFVLSQRYTTAARAR